MSNSFYDEELLVRLNEAIDQPLDYNREVSTAIQQLQVGADSLRIDPISGMIEEGKDQEYVLNLSSPASMINKLIIVCLSGTVTATIKINGVSVTGLEAVSVSSIQVEALATALNNVLAGDRLSLFLSSSVSPVNVSFTLERLKGI